MIPAAGCAKAVRAGLFIADELKIHPQATANAEASARKVSELQGQLAKRGVKLLVVLVPDKSRIAAQQLCAIERSPLSGQPCAGLAAGAAGQGR